MTANIYCTIALAPFFFFLHFFQLWKRNEIESDISCTVAFYCIRQIQQIQNYCGQFLACSQVNIQYVYRHITTINNIVNGYVQSGVYIKKFVSPKKH